MDIFGVLYLEDLDLESLGGVWVLLFIYKFFYVFYDIMENYCVNVLLLNECRSELVNIRKIG